VERAQAVESVLDSLSLISPSPLLLTDFILSGEFTFQSFFILITVQPLLFALDIRVSLNIPIFDSAL